jgi:hypothetical protein
MEQENIRELLAKYYNGETSEEEELVLREYLGSAAAPASLTGTFGYLAAGTDQVPEPSEGFGAKLDEITRKEVRLASPGTRWLSFAGIGAAAAIIAAALLIFNPVRTPGDRDTFSDPALAMAEVKNILLTVSGKMNTGTAQLEQVGEITSRPEELNSLTTINGLVGRNLSRLRYLNDMQPQEIKKETEK